MAGLKLFVQTESCGKTRSLIGQDVSCLRAYIVFAGSKPLQRQQQIVLIRLERETVVDGYDGALDQIPDDGIEVLHSVQLSIPHGVEQRLALGFSILDIFTGSWRRLQNLYGGNAAAHVRARN